MQTERDRAVGAPRRAETSGKRKMKVGKRRAAYKAGTLLAIFERGIAATQKYQRRAV
jgi:hypothetical protein